MERMVPKESSLISARKQHLGLTKSLRYSPVGVLLGMSLLLPSIASAQVTDSYVKLLYPNGGESLKVGDTATIIWEKSNNVGDCNISFLTKNPGKYKGGETLSPIDRAYTGTGVGEPRIGTYDWIVYTGTMDESESKQVKIDLLCYRTDGKPQVETQSADYLTVFSGE